MKQYRSRRVLSSPLIWFLNFQPIPRLSNLPCFNEIKSFQFLSRTNKIFILRFFKKSPSPPCRVLFLISKRSGNRARHREMSRGYRSDICAVRAGIPAVRCSIARCPLIDNRHYRSTWGRGISVAMLRLTKGENVEGGREIRSPRNNEKFPGGFITQFGM